MSIYARSSRDHVGRYADRQFGAWLSADDITSTLNKIRSFVMPPVSTDALVDIANLVRVILTRKVPGAVVECGAWRGGTAFFMAELLKAGRRAGPKSVAARFIPRDAAGRGD